MAKQFSEFTGQFFWDFKRMDNVNYNFSIIEKLYSAKKANGGDKLFNKPIINTIVGIIECCLYDYTTRINQHVRESIPNMALALVAHLKAAKPKDELSILIARVEAHNLLEIKPGDNLYKDLDFIRKVRNRSHVQNKYHELDYNESTQHYKDEGHVFTDSTLTKAQDCLERIIEFLAINKPRPGNPAISMTDFPRPWI